MSRPVQGQPSPLVSGALMLPADSMIWIVVVVVAVMVGTLAYASSELIWQPDAFLLLSRH